MKKKKKGQNFCVFRNQSWNIWSGDMTDGIDKSDKNHFWFGSSLCPKTPRALTCGPKSLQLVWNLVVLLVVCGRTTHREQWTLNRDNKQVHIPCIFDRENGPFYILLALLSKTFHPMRWSDGRELIQFDNFFFHR